MKRTTVSERALILAPRGRDATVAAAMLVEAQIVAEICGSLPELIHELDRGAGVVILTEEALVTADLSPLSMWISDQPEWSDLPFVLLTKQGGGLERNPAARRYLDILSNATFIERPFHPTTLVSLVSSALRGRRKQYEARSRLIELRDSAERFRFLDRLGATTQPLTDPNAVMAETAQLLGVQLDVSICAYADMDADQDGLTIRGNWIAADAPSLVGHYRLADFGGTAVRSLTQGHAFVTRDVAADLPASEAATFLALGVHATICMALVRDGRLAALMAVHCLAPRDWTDAEISLVADTTSRSWAHVERVRAEAALRQSEARFRAAVDAVQGLLWTNDSQGRMMGEQPGWAALTGQTRDEYEGFGWASVVHPDDAQPTIDAWNAATADERVFIFEHRVRRHDGAWRDFAIHAVPVRDADKNVIEWVGVHRDITEARAAQAALYRANETLEQRVTAEVAERAKAEDALRQAQKMEAIGQLTGGVAHDFNNLLTIIKSSTEFLRRPSLADDRRKRYVETISETVDRAAKLTGQLLAFARRQALKPEVFDVTQRLDGVVDMMRTIVGSRITIDSDISTEICAVEADVSQFETALINITVNARDAMDGEGALSVRVGPVDGIPAIRGHGGSSASFIAVSVTDTGCGISADKIGHIFEPFYTTKEVGKGTGLGLSQVFGFAKQSGGDVAVESDIGRGTTFTLYLPRVRIETAADDRAGGHQHPVPTEQGRGQRILIVEDNVDVGRFSTEILQDLGYETRWAANAKEALSCLDEGGQFDAVFSDVIMPGMSGVDLGHEIRRRYPGLPVVLTSGYSHVLAEEGRHGFELLHKPYAAEDLSRLLRRVTANRASR